MVGAEGEDFDPVQAAITALSSSERHFLVSHLLLGIVRPHLAIEHKAQVHSEVRYWASADSMGF